MIAAAAAICRATTAALPAWDLPPCGCRELVQGTGWSIGRTDISLPVCGRTAAVACGAKAATGQTFPDRRSHCLCNWDPLLPCKVVPPEANRLIPATLGTGGTANQRWESMHTAL